MSEYSILGFDPASTRNIGWSVITIKKQPKKASVLKDWLCGTFVMEPVEQKWQVLWPMFVIVNSFIENQKPDLVILEKTSQFAGGFITGQVSQCMGVIYAACGKNNCKVEFAYPTSVKKIVTGNGRAKKGDIKRSVSEFLNNHGIKGVKFDSEHAADASATILYWLIKKEIII